MKAYNAIFIIAFILLSNSSPSQDVPNVLSMEQAINIALENNFDIKIAENNAELQQNNAVRANAGYLPSLNLSGGYNYQNQNTNLEFASDQNPPINVSGAETQTLNAGISLNYIIYNGGARKNTFRKLQNQAQIGQLQERLNMENTINSVIRQYLSALNFYSSLLIRGQSVKLSYDRYSRAKDKYNYGNISKLELLNAQVDLSNDSSEFLQAEIDLNKAKNELNSLMGFGPDQKYDLDTGFRVQENLELEKFIEKALNDNSRYLIQKINRENSMTDLKINNAQRLPNLSLSGGYDYSFQDTEAGFIQQSENLGWKAGVTLSYNIFDGNRVNRNEQNSRIQIENQELGTEQLEINLQKDIYNAYEDYEAGKRLINLRKNNLRLAETNYERSVEAYSIGQIDGIQLREAQINLLNAEYSLTLQKIQTKNAEVNLFLLSGSLIED